MSPVEQTLARIWAEVLSRDQVGPTDELLALGGASLDAVDIAARVRTAFAVELDATMLLAGATVAQVAQHIERAQTSGRQVHSIVRTGAPDAPLSFGQERLWFLERLSPNTSTYHVAHARRLRGPLDRHALERALAALARRHEALRTVFGETDGQPRQTVLAEVPVELAVESVADAVALERRATVLARAAFDLQRGPPWRALLLHRTDGPPNEHILVLIVHHLVCDGWSMSVLWRELGMLYSAYRGEGRLELSPPALSHLDFAAWERGALAGDRLRVSVAYWRARLEGLAPALTLPADLPVSPANTAGDAGAVTEAVTGARSRVRLTAQLTRQLTTLGREAGCTRYMTVLAALSLLLSRYAGQRDITVGCPVARRRQPETHGTVGLFVNTLVLRIDVDAALSFRALLEQIRRVTVDGSAHQDVPFERVVQELGPERTLDRTPLFQVLLNSPTPIELGAFVGLEVERVEVTEPEARFELAFYLEAFEEELELRLVADRRRFSSGAVDRILCQLERLLESLAAQPERPLREHSLLTRTEAPTLPEPRRALPPPPRPSTVPELFAICARRYPDAPAITSRHGVLAYGELAAAAARIAGVLASHAIEPGAVVAVTGERSAGLVAAVLAVLRCGTLLTLDPELPPAWKASLLREARAQLVISAGDRDDFTATAGLRSVRVDPATGAPELDGAPPPFHAFDEPPSSDHAYVFFTSGTTGTPKGVVGSHRGLAHFLEWQRSTFAVGPTDRVAFTTGLGFDVVLRDILLPLVSGAALSIPTGEPGLGWLADQAITVLHVVPTVASAWLAREPQRRCPALRLVLFAGEPLTGGLVRRWRLACPHAEVVNLYGPTETTLAICWQRVPEDPGQGIQPLGRPLPNTQALVLADRQRLCAVGELGEICLRTPFRSHGYLAAGGANQAAFFPNPLRDDPSDQLYATGDLGRYDSDGTLHFAGRRDQQVKIRGVRVEPQEVAAALAQHAGVAACAVVPLRNDEGDTELGAYVVPTAGAAVAVAELRRHLAAALPLAMVPARFALVEQIPRTPAGKVDAGAVQQALDRPVVPAPPTAPRTPIEEALVEVWRELLGRPTLGVHDSFFELGGHSLLAMRVAARVTELFGTTLALRAFFEAPTVAELGARIEALLGAEKRPSDVLRRRRQTTAPLSFGQARLWFLHQLTPASRAYHIAQARQLAHPEGSTAIAEALGEVVRRHEALRTVFEVDRGTAIGRVGEPFTPAVQTVTLEAESALPDAMKQLARRPFDLARGPLLRATLLHTPERSTVLLLVVHHLVADGWSMGLIWQELATLLAARRAGRPAQLAEPAVQFGDWAAWEQEPCDGAAAARDLAFWLDELRGATGMLSLPLDHRRPPIPTDRGGRCGILLEPALAEQLRSLATAEGCTLYMTLLAALAVTLWRFSGQTGLVVGCPTAGRRLRETEETVGFFVSTLPLRIEVDGETSFRELLRRVRGVALRAFAHASTPLEQLVARLAPDRALAHNPLFQIMLALYHAPSTEGLGARLEVDVGTSKMDLALMLVDEGPAGVRGHLEYALDLFEHESARQIAHGLERVLRLAVACPGGLTGELSASDEADQLRGPRSWNATERPYEPQTIDGLFARQAAQTPTALAVEGAGERWTYRALDNRAHDVARALQRLGVGAGDRVGIALERTPVVVAALLGVLRSGAAFVPLDRAEPPERARWILEDAQVRVLVTERAFGARLPAYGGSRLLLDELEPAEAPATPSHHDTSSLAYVLYTSGSTGRPKGVMGTHRGLCNRLQWMWDAYPFDPSERCCHKTSLGFVDSLAEIFGPLCAGVAAVMLPDCALRDPRELRTALAAEQVTRLTLVPSLLQALLDVTPGLGAELPRLTLWTCSGEPLAADVVRRFRAAAPGARLLNLYGSSEVAGDATCFEATDLATTDRTPIGRPIANVEVWVLDDQLRPLSIGMPGELCAGGAGLALGYHGQPALTAERFVPHPLAPGKLLYRSGDLGRWLASGQLELLGRRDEQVSIRGCRVEPEEIECVLRQHAAVREVAVVAHGEASDRRLVAHVVGHADPRALRQHAADRLPAYLVPDVFADATVLPRTASGKLDRRLLARRTVLPATAEPEFVAPRSTLEEQLAAAFAEVTGRERVGVHDNFFDLGGHSLLAVRLTAVLEQRLDRAVAVAALFRAPTVAALAAELSRPADGPRLIVSLRHDGRPPPLVLVHPIGGTLFCYQRLAHLLDERQVLGIQALGMDPSAEPPASIAGMADRYLDALDEAQPRGPYWLGGWSMGGVIAQQMARRLVERGEQVGLLVMLDSSAAPPRTRHILHDESLLAVRRLHYEALMNHQPGSYAGRAVLFRAAATDWAPDLGWGSLMPGLVVEETAGDHDSLLRPPHLGPLAARLRAHLRAAEEELNRATPVSCHPPAAR